VTKQLFDPGREGFAKGEISWTVATVKAYLCRSYTFNAAHKFTTDLTGAGGVLIQAVTLTGKDSTSGVQDATDALWTSVPAQPGNVPATSLVFIQTSAVGGGADVATSAQRLIGYTDEATNFPVVPNGGNIEWQFPSGADKIFKL
jgi:hypothetical protein